MQTILLRLKRLFSTNLLNILGLSIAFAAFIIIMVQINYDFTYDKCYKNADRIYRVETLDRHTGEFVPFVTRPMGELIVNSFSEIEKGGCEALWDYEAYFSKPNGTEEPIFCEYFKVSQAMPEVFDFEMIAGKLDELSQINGMIIPESMAKKLFSNELAVGKELVLSKNKIPSTNKEETDICTIVGVYKDFPQNARIENLAYVNIHDFCIDDRTQGSFVYYLKLYESANPKTLAKEIETFITTNYYENEVVSDVNTDYLRLNQIHDVYFSRDLSAFDLKGNYSVTISLLTIAILIVVIAIINFINFSMAAVPLSIRRINTMKVLGSTNTSLRIQQIINVIILSLVSYGIALLIVYSLAGTSFASFVSADIHLNKNANILIFSGLVAIITGIIGGLYPAFYSTSFPPAIVLKGSFGLSAKGRQLRSSLIAFQYVISISLLIVSIFVFVQNSFMKNHDMGFRTDNILTVQTSAKLVNQKDAFLSQLKTNPNILDLTFSDGPIVSSGKMGWGRDYKGKFVSFSCFPASTNFLDFFGFQIVDGRGFRESDELKRNGTIIFNQVAVEQFEFEVGDVISGHMGEETPADIVGIMKNFNFQPMQYKIQPIALYVYGSEPWQEQEFAFIKITGKDFKNSIEHIRKTLVEFDPNLSDATVNFMDKRIEQLYKKEDNLAKLILIFCALSVFISIIGVLGLIFFETQFRKKEIGIRRVFGSSVSEILSMFNKEYLKITAICYLISIPIAFLIIREWLKNFAYRSPIPFWVWIVAFVVIFALTAIVISLQSLRTARSNPVNSIKSDS